MRDDRLAAKQPMSSGDTAAEAEEDENWVSVGNVSDLAGPVILVFSSKPVMSLTCNQLGAVFVSKVEKHGRRRRLERGTTRCKAGRHHDTRARE